MERALDRLGPWLLALGVALVGLVQLWHGGFEAPWRPAPAMLDGGTWARIDGVFLLLAVTAFLAWQRRPAALVLAVFTLVWLLVAHLAPLIASPAEPTAWVGPVEALGLGAVWLALASERPRLWVVARIAVGAMLIVFGVVHWLEREAVAGLIPSWMPGGGAWLWLTAAANVLAGAALISGVLWRPAAALVGLMFASWIVLVHAGRLAADPSSAFEQAFAATAVVLTGAVWTLLTPRRQRDANLSSA